MIVPCIHIVKNLTETKWGRFKVSGFKTMYGFCLPASIVYVCLLRKWPYKPFPTASRGLVW